MAPVKLSQEQVKIIGKRLRELRRQVGYFRQDDLAAAAELSLSYISKLESGNVVPRDDQIYRDLAELLGVPAEWLLQGRTDGSDGRPQALPRRVADGRPDNEDQVRSIVQQTYDLIQDPEAISALQTLADKQGASVVDILVSLVR